MESGVLVVDRKLFTSLVVTLPDSFFHSVARVGKNRVVGIVFATFLVPQLAMILVIVRNRLYYYLHVIQILIGMKWALVDITFTEKW